MIAGLTSRERALIHMLSDGAVLREPFDVVGKGQYSLVYKSVPIQVSKGMVDKLSRNGFIKASIIKGERILKMTQIGLQIAKWMEVV